MCIIVFVNIWNVIKVIVKKWMKILNYFKGGVISWSVLGALRIMGETRDCSGKLKVFRPEMRPVHPAFQLLFVTWPTLGRKTSNSMVDEVMWTRMNSVANTISELEFFAVKNLLEISPLFYFCTHNYIPCLCLLLWVLFLIYFLLLRSGLFHLFIYLFVCSRGGRGGVEAGGSNRAYRPGWL